VEGLEVLEVLDDEVVDLVDLVARILDLVGRFLDAGVRKALALAIHEAEEVRVGNRNS